MTLSEQDWEIRLHIYEYFVEHEQPPTVAQTAAVFGLPIDAVREAYHRLHDHHTLFLEPGTDSVRMANPLSAVPTAYKVFINVKNSNKQLWANCAWDSLGIPAMLNADARIVATIPQSGETVTYAIQDGKLQMAEDLTGALVHFPLPFRRWYDNLIDT